MTDMAFDDHRSLGAAWDAHPARPADADARRAAKRREYRAYFAVLFLLELPLALVAWTLRALRGRSWPTQGPLAAARSRAALVTSLILSV